MNASVTQPSCTRLHLSVDSDNRRINPRCNVPHWDTDHVARGSPFSGLTRNLMNFIIQPRAGTLELTSGVIREKKRGLCGHQDLLLCNLLRLCDFSVPSSSRLECVICEEIFSLFLCLNIVKFVTEVSESRKNWRESIPLPSSCSLLSFNYT